MATYLTNTTDLTAVADAIRAKSGTAGALTFPNGFVSDISGIKTKTNISWHQCPEAVRNYLANVTYDPSDYSTSQIANYAPGTPVAANTKPIGKTFDGVTYYNEVPNGNTPFNSTNYAGTVNPLDQVRWLNTATVNVRDIGGWACDGGTVKYGMLVRGGEPNAADKSIMVNQVGIRHELQLRGTSEMPQDYSLWDVPFTYVDQYAWMTLTPVATWKTIFNCVFSTVNKNIPLYLHCAAGADRTGTVAVMLEALLGMSQSDIDKDYELTCFFSGTDTDAHARRRNETEYRNYIAAIKAVPLVGGLSDSFRNRAISFVLSLGFTIDQINAYRHAMINGTVSDITVSMSSYSVTRSSTNITYDNNIVSVTEYQPYGVKIMPAAGYALTDVSVTMGGNDITAQVFSGKETFVYGSVTNSLTYCSSSWTKSYTMMGQAFVCELTADAGYTMEGATVSITMGGVDVSTYYSNGTIAIPNVTGNIVITATAVQSAPPYTNLADPSSADWKNDYRLNSSRVETAAEGHFVTNKIPLLKGQVLRIKGVLTPQGGDNHYGLSSTDTVTALNTLNQIVAAGYASYDSATATITWTAFTQSNGSQPSTADSVVYYRGSFSFATGYTASDIIITVDEPID